MSVLLYGAAIPVDRVPDIDIGVNAYRFYLGDRLIEAYLATDILGTEYDGFRVDIHQTPDHDQLVDACSEMGIDPDTIGWHLVPESR